MYEANPSLGNWVHTQRTQYNKGALVEERMQQLNDLEFEWRLCDECVPWEQRLVSTLLQFKFELCIVQFTPQSCYTSYTVRAGGIQK